jgi:hypothetical protein
MTGDIFKFSNLALMDSHHSDDEEDEVSNNCSLYDSDV